MPCSSWQTAPRSKWYSSLCVLGRGRLHDPEYALLPGLSTWRVKSFKLSVTCPPATHTHPHGMLFSHSFSLFSALFPAKLSLTKLQFSPNIILPAIELHFTQHRIHHFILLSGFSRGCITTIIIQIQNISINVKRNQYLSAIATLYLCPLFVMEKLYSSIWMDPHRVYPFISWWTFGLFPLFGY